MVPYDIATLEPGSKTVPVVFSGKAGEFFGVWIVNVLLSIVSLGIYSAWAKVRTKNYFYGNTKIDGHAFSYLADPLPILKGRVLAVILLAAYSLAANFFPPIALLLIIVTLFIAPLIINQSLRFNSRMSSYRNVRFAFKGNYCDSLLFFIVLPISCVFTLYLATPWALKKMDEYIYNNISYGDKPLKINLLTTQYYLTCFSVLLVSTLSTLGVGMIVQQVIVATGDVMPGESLDGLVSIVLMLLYLVTLSAMSGLYRAYIRNHIFNNSKFEQLVRFKSQVNAGSYALLLLVNMLAIICTVGLAYPWARVRKAAFLAENTEVLIRANAQEVLETMGNQRSAFGEEAADVFNIEIALT